MFTVKKLILINILACFILFAGFSVSAEAYYDMDISIGFDNQAKYGRYVPVSVTIYGEESLDGMLSVSIEFDDESKQVASYPITITEYENTVFETWVPLFDKNSKVYFELKNLAGEEVQKKIVQPKMLDNDYTELFVGVLSKSQKVGELFDSINLGEYTDISFPYIFTRSFDIGVEDIRGEVEYTLDCLDIIVVMADVIPMLTKEQEDMLVEWTAAGKTLIVEYDNEKLSNEYRALYRETLKNKKEEDELRPGFWIYSADYGDGRICFSVTPAGDRGFYEYVNTSLDLVGMTLAKATTLEMVDDIIYQDMYYTNYDDTYEIQYMLNEVQGKDNPDILKYIVTIAVYIILAGPILYFILKIWEKVHYVLPCIIVLAGLFSVLIYKMGEETRFTDIFLQYANIIEIGAEETVETTYFSANIPYNDTYYMKFKSDYYVTPLLRGKADEASDNDYIEILYTEEDTKVTLNKGVPFSEEYFKAERVLGNGKEWKFDSDITYYNGVVNGSIVNNTGQDLKNVALILYDKIIYLGDIDNAEVKDISTSNLSMLSYYSRDVANMIINASEGEEAGTSEKSSMIEYVVSKYFSEQSTEPMLIGFVDMEENIQLGNDYEAYGNTLFYGAVDVNTVIGNLSYEPATAENIFNIDNNNNYDAYSNTTYNSRIRLQYYFEDKETLVRLIFSTMHEAEESDAYYGTFDGEVYFYNNVTMEYDAIDIEQTYFGVALLEEYLLEENGGYTLIVQYIMETEDDYRYKEIKLPSVSAIRRLDYVEDN